jgi:hypothetical protein
MHKGFKRGCQEAACRSGFGKSVAGSHSLWSPEKALFVCEIAGSSVEFFGSLSPGVMSSGPFEKALSVSGNRGGKQTVSQKCFIS